MFTTEQQAVIDYIKESTTDELILINAVAGAGKTTLLQGIIKEVPHKNGIYLAYNKSIAVEAQGKFPSSVSCLTTHSLAYRNTIRQLGLRVGFFNYRSITERMAYDKKLVIAESIREYCLSDYTNFSDYAEEVGLSEKQIEICQKYIKAMYEGQIECSHDFYLKVFHLLLAKQLIELPKVDFLLVDECGDLNPVTLEIFKLYPAKVKIAVGDQAQSVYGFNYTINAFTELEGQGKMFRLTQSFRVAEHIAAKIEDFCQSYIDRDMRFKGVPLKDTKIETEAYIARTNAGLINTMIDLNASRVPFTTVRKLDEIFKLPNIIAGLTYQGEIFDKEYKHIQSAFDDWYEDKDTQLEYSTPFSYLLSLYEHDVPISQALKLVLAKGKKKVFETYNIAKRYEGQTHRIILSTAHSMKGLEFDRVVINEDLNTVVGNIIDSYLQRESMVFTDDEIQELNLYYVACSRAKKVLDNARILEIY